MPSAMAAINTMEDFIRQVSQNVKTAEANTEPGSIGGTTGHPSKDVDDRTEVATTGERAAENEKDVKEDQGAAGVNSRPDAKAAALRLLRKKAEGSAAATPGSAPDDQIQIGTNKQPTGEDSSVETESVKGGKKDPGSSHPARTDNDDLPGGKYAADTPLEKLAADLTRLGEVICSQMYSELETPKTASHQQHQPAYQGQHNVAHDMGGELAAILNGTMNKQAADAMVHRTLQEVIKRASADADNYAYFLYSLQEEQKNAEEMIPPEMLEGGSDAGGGLPVGGGEHADGGGGDEEAMMAALGGGESAEPDGDEGGEEGGINPELLALLEQLGVGDDDVEAGAAEELAAGGGDPGAGDPGAMGPDAGGAPPMIDPAKMASDRKKTTGKPTGKSATDSSMNMIRELIERSRNSR
jgi:hypothetical protein